MRDREREERERQSLGEWGSLVAKGEPSLGSILGLLQTILDGVKFPDL